MNDYSLVRHWANINTARYTFREAVEFLHETCTEMIDVGHSMSFSRKIVDAPMHGHLAVVYFRISTIVVAMGAHDIEEFSWGEPSTVRKSLILPYEGGRPDWADELCKK